MSVPILKARGIMQGNSYGGLEGFDMALPDGELVSFRPVRPEHRKIVAEGMSALSFESRLFRFFTPMVCLSAQQLDYFTEVDQSDHVAWIALSSDNAGQTGLGIARFIRLPHQPRVAEFAIVVIDSYQNRGLGLILLALLYKMAVSKAIDTLRASVSLENKVMRRWLARLGAVGQYDDDGSYTMDWAVAGKPPDLTLPSLQRLKAIIVKIDEAMSQNVVPDPL
ncbi:GNAT family N-acetyltransferase [Methylovulum psychrotolerans]|nr:GNAT family N-acetyltransferase [Methylovulum psychrotolerans]